MSDWKAILELADKISDKKLKKKVVDYLKNPQPTHKEFKQLLKLDEAPAATQWHHVYKGGLLRHILAVTKIALAITEQVEEVYNIKIDKDVILAAGLCHDVMKICEYRAEGDRYEMSLPLPLDHLTLGVTELYARNFPKKVIHAVAAHHGEAGPVTPEDPEAIILHFADMLDAYANLG